LADTDPSAFQYTTLIVNDIFVENIQVVVDSKAYLSAFSRKTFVDNLTASAIASELMLPRHSSIIVSQANPSPIWSRNSMAAGHLKRYVYGH